MSDRNDRAWFDCNYQNSIGHLSNLIRQLILVHFFANILASQKRWVPKLKQTLSSNPKDNLIQRLTSIKP